VTHVQPEGLAPAPMAPPVVTLRKSGTILEISPDGQSALPGHARRVLEPILSYQHKKFLYGAARKCPVTNIDRRLEITNKQLYRYDQLGRMVTGFGFYHRVGEILKENGYQLRYINKDPKAEERTRPMCYEFHPELVQPHFQFRARQDECLNNISKSPCGVVHAATGFGKMVQLAMHILAFPYATFNITTKRTRLLRKMQAFLTRYIPEVGLIGDGSKDRGRRVTLYSADSLHHADPWDSDFLCGDEAHELLADRSSMFLAKYRYARMFAYTATDSGRVDGTDVRMESLFGPRIFSCPYWEAVALGLVVPIRVEWSDVKMDTNPADKDNETAKKRWGMWRNNVRNEIIAGRARGFGDDEQVMILVDTVEHAMFLRQHLPDYTLVYGANEVERWEYYMKHDMIPAHEPKMTPKRIEQLRQEFEDGTLKKVIATGVWAVGIDPVHLVALIRASGGSSEIMDVQAPGRVARRPADPKVKPYGVVCDFRDQFDSNFSNAARNRFRHYKEMRWDQFITTPAGPRPLPRFAS
jgi:superfamily II DNA or RNA helicase